MTLPTYIKERSIEWKHLRTWSHVLAAANILLELMQGNRNCLDCFNNKTELWFLFVPFRQSFETRACFLIKKVRDALQFLRRHFAAELVLPELVEPWIPSIRERIQRKVVRIEFGDVGTVNSYGNTPKCLSLETSHHVGSVGPTIAASTHA